MAWSFAAGVCGILGCHLAHEIKPIHAVMRLRRGDPVLVSTASVPAASQVTSSGRTGEGVITGHRVQYRLRLAARSRDRAPRCAGFGLAQSMWGRAHCGHGSSLPRCSPFDSRAAWQSPDSPNDVVPGDLGERLRQLLQPGDIGEHRPKCMDRVSIRSQIMAVGRRSAVWLAGLG